MSISKSDVETYAIGAGTYYGLLWIFTFYPAVVMGVFVCQWVDPPVMEKTITTIEGKELVQYEEDSEYDSNAGTALIYGIITMIIGWAILAVLVLLRKYVLLLIIYVVTFWPFWSMVYRSIEFSSEQWTPFPPLNWCPFW